jgi:hypothetical protein
MQLYRYFVSQSSEFCRHNPLCCFSTCLLFLFRYQFSPKTFGYTLVCQRSTLEGCGVDSSGSDYGPAAGSFEYGNNPSGFMKDKEFLN